MKIVVTGSRDWPDSRKIRYKLDEFAISRTIERVGVGDATGVDDAAATWAIMRKIDCRVYAADWRRLGKIAGPARNERMLLTERPDVLLAFPGGSGTDDCKKRAERLGIQIVEMTFL